MKYLRVFENDDSMKSKQLKIIVQLIDAIRKDIISNMEGHSWRLEEYLFDQDMMEEYHSANYEHHNDRSSRVNFENIQKLVEGGDVSEFIIDFMVRVDFLYVTWGNMDNHKEKMDELIKFTKTLDLLDKKYGVKGVNLGTKLQFEIQYSVSKTFDELNKLYKDINI